MWEKIDEEIMSGVKVGTYRMSVPEGWMVAVVVGAQHVTMQYTPDKQHTWMSGNIAEPLKENRS